MAMMVKAGMSGKQMRPMFKKKGKLKPNPASKGHTTKLYKSSK